MREFAFDTAKYLYHSHVFKRFIGFCGYAMLHTEK